jgi:hypothetical protein
MQKPTRDATGAHSRSVSAPKNADAVIQALGNLARAQERGLPEFVLEQLQERVMDAAGEDGHLLQRAA